MGSDGVDYLETEPVASIPISATSSVLELRSSEKK